MPHPIQSLIAIVVSRRIARNAAQVSAVVGTVLNLVNQGASIWEGHDISWLHLAMNYIVPYCVASYSAARNELSRRAAPAAADCSRLP